MHRGRICSVCCTALEDLKLLPERGLKTTVVGSLVPRANTSGEASAFLAMHYWLILVTRGVSAQQHARKIFPLYSDKAEYDSKETSEE